MIRFNTERDAWNHWVGLHQFHGADIPRSEMFTEWVDNNRITWLDEDMAEWLRKEWKNEL